MYLSELKKIFEAEKIEYFGALPIERCEIIRRYKIDRLPFRPRNAVVFAVPYYTGDNPARIVSKYAVSRDYHLFFSRLYERLCPELEKMSPGSSFRGFVDDSPIRETDAAALCGVGMKGENHLIITEKYGSYVFLGEILTDADVESSIISPRVCPGCGRCKKACPSPESCLSAATQKKGELTPGERRMMIKYRTAWGCDICQDVCPYNSDPEKTPVEWFYKDRIFTPPLGMELKDRAYEWRGRAVIERNLEIIYGGSIMTEELLESIKDAASEAGKIMLSAAGVTKDDVEEKSGRANFVTKYDIMVQTYLQERLKEIIPDAYFVGEEGDQEFSGDRIRKGVCFIVDPIDGTTNFMFGAEKSAVCIAVSELGKVTAGVVYDPYKGEMFYAMKGRGAYLNGKAIHTRELPLSECVYMFGTSPYYKELHDIGWKVARRLFDKSLDLRRGGSAALDLCWLASGRAGVFTEMKLSPWDYAAASIILEEAGGKITSMDGSPITIDKPCSIFAACGRAYDEAFEEIRQIICQI